ncbi:MAG: EamA family transporter RarD [Planctomycetota bacterium]
MSSSTRLGLLLAVAAHALWGLFPIYWKLLAAVDSAELACHRILWAFLFSFFIAAVRFRIGPPERRSAFFSALRRKETWLTYSFAASMIAINWIAFLVAVNNGNVLLSSLGYYINPLFNVLLGVLVLGEKLHGRGWLAIGIAGVGVAIMTVAIGELPWVSLAMATSFAMYGLAKKKAKLDPLDGLLLETGILIVPTVCFLSYLSFNDEGAFGAMGYRTDSLLIFGGLVTIIPLALFAGATQRAPLSMIGVLQYIGPTLQFLVGTVYFGEKVTQSTLLGFAFVWTGVIVFLSRGRSRAPEATDQQSNAQPE